MAPSLRALYSQMTVEPLIILSAIGVLISSPVYMQLFLNKTCRQELHYSAAVCSNLSDHQEESHRVEEQWNRWNAYAQLCNALPALVFSLAVAAWSDRFGRKTAIQLPLCGGVAAALLLLLNVFVDLPIWQLLVVPILQGFGGGYMTLLAEAMSYVSDTSTDGPERTTRFGILIGCMFLGFSVGGFGGGVLLGALGPNGGALACFLVYLGTTLLSMLYVAFGMRETIDSSQYTWQYKLREFFSMRAFTDVWTVMSEKRGEGDRGRFWLLMIAGSLFFFIFGGTGTITQPYMEMAPINWSLAELMQWQSIIMLCNVAGVFALVPLAKHYLSLSDTALAILGIVSQAVPNFIMAVTTNSVVIVAGWFAGIMYVVAPVAVRALLSRVVGADEQARAFALYAFVENGMPAFGGIAFAMIFSFGVSLDYRALPFALSVALSAIPIGIIWKLHADVLGGRTKMGGGEK